MAGQDCASSVNISHVIFNVVLHLLLHFFSGSETASIPLTPAASDATIFFAVREELPPETVVGDLSREISYTDPAVLRSLRYVFLRHTNQTSLFLLDDKTGILRTRNVIDRDVMCSQQWTCSVRLDVVLTPAAYFTMFKIDVLIGDINDNAPVFPRSRTRLTIPENLSPELSESYRIQSATDVDSPPNGVAEYRLSRFLSQSAAETFRLDVRNNSAGVLEPSIIMLKELDRELTPDGYELVLIAVDGGEPRRSSSLIIDIDVADVNDNSPVFERAKYEVEVLENVSIGTTVVRLRATDLDIGQNGHVRYRFSQRSEMTYGDMFALDIESGDVVLLQKLDHADQRVFSLGLIAEDQGGFKTSPALAALIINVIDVNDHTPQISVDPMNGAAVLNSTTSVASGGEADGDGFGGGIEIPENADMGTFVAHVSTSDADAGGGGGGGAGGDGEGGENGRVECSIDSADFRLVPMYQGEYTLVTASRLDREEVSSYNVLITCHDMGTPPLYVTKNVLIIVGDVNDHEPRFSSDVYNATLPENSPWGSFVVRVEATDPDRGVNGELAYMLEPSMKDHFHIDPETGAITTLAALDHETMPNIHFQVIAANTGEASRSSRALVHLTVTDVDDERPTFSSPSYSFNVPENQPSLTEVGTVRAIDRDSAPFNSFSYKLDPTSSTAASAFLIDPSTGVIKTRSPLDREKCAEYRLTVTVESLTVTPYVDTAIVVITVLDENDNAPVIVFPNDNNRTVSVPATPPGQATRTFTGVAATDSDEGANAELKYEIVPDDEELREGRSERGWNGSSLFVIDRFTGRIRANYRADLPSVINETFVIGIRVMDSGRPPLSTTTFLVFHIIEGGGLLDPPLLFDPADNYEDVTNGSNFVPVTAQLLNWLSGNTLVLVAAAIAVFVTIVAVLVVAALLMRKRGREKLNRLSSVTVELTEISAAARNDHDVIGEECKELLRMRTSSTSSVDRETTLSGSVAGQQQRNGVLVLDGEPKQFGMPHATGNSTSGAPHHCLLARASNASGGRSRSAEGDRGSVLPGGSGDVHGDTDSGCADVSNLNDDGSNGSDRSSKDLETDGHADDVLPHNKQITTAPPQTYPYAIAPATKHKHPHRNGPSTVHGKPDYIRYKATPVAFLPASSNSSPRMSSFLAPNTGPALERSPASFYSPSSPRCSLENTRGMDDVDDDDAVNRANSAIECILRQGSDSPVYHGDRGLGSPWVAGGSGASSAPGCGRKIVRFAADESGAGPAADPMLASVASEPEYRATEGGNVVRPANERVDSLNRRRLSGNFADNDLCRRGGAGTDLDPYGRISNVAYTTDAWIMDMNRNHDLHGEVGHRGDGRGDSRGGGRTGGAVAQGRIGGVEIRGRDEQGFVTGTGGRRASAGRGINENRPGVEMTQEDAAAKKRVHFDRSGGVDNLDHVTCLAGSSSRGDDNESVRNGCAVIGRNGSIGGVKDPLVTSPFNGVAISGHGSGSPFLHQYPSGTTLLKTFVHPNEELGSCV